MEKKQNRLVVASAAWGETLPQWLKDEIAEERMTLGIASAIKPTQEVGDAEACAYLYTASLTAPMPHELNQIYIYLAAKLMKRRRMEIADFMEEKLKAGLTADEARQLADLKRELYTKRGGEISHPLLDALREMKRAGRQRRCASPSEQFQEVI